MSIFNRIAGTEQPKIPVWPLMTDYARVLDQEAGFGLAELSVKYEFSVAEQAEAAEYLAHLSSMVATRSGELIAANMPQPLSLEISRSVVDSKFRHGLLRAENRTITEEQLKLHLGMTS